MRHATSATLLLIAGALAAAEPAANALPTFEPELATVDNRQVKVLNKKDITFPLAADVDLKLRELYFAKLENGQWGEWQKHGQTFPKDSPVQWAPPEGHLRVHFRKVLTSDLASPVPGPTAKAQAEFIIDRTAPTGAIGFPAPKAKLRGGDTYTVTWTAADANLRAQPIALRWSRDGSSFDVVAEKLANSGSFQWTVPRDLTTTGVLQLVVADKAGNVFTTEAGNILVDSIKPTGRVTGPTITAKAEVALDTEIADKGESGLVRAQLWVSQDDGGSWTEGPVIPEPFKQVAWKAPADGTYRLAVVATDGAGNVTAKPTGKVGDQLVVDTEAPKIQLAAATGVSDAEKAGPSQRRFYKPGDRVQVQFLVKDKNLVPTSAVISWQPAADKAWIELGKGQPTDAAFRFQIPADAPACKAARIKVQAGDAAGNVGEAVAVESFEIQTAVVVDDTVEINP